MVLRKTNKTLDVFKVLMMAGSLLIASHGTALAQEGKEDGDVWYGDKYFNNTRLI